MEPARAHVEEIKSLQRCINDLISVLALPAMWSGGEPAHIVNTLLDALVGMLGLDVAYARMKCLNGHTPVAALRLWPQHEQSAQSEQLRNFLDQTFGDDPRDWPSVARHPVGSDDFHFVPLRLGLHDEAGLIVAGSRRPSFPEQTERLLLSVAANQAAIGLQDAQMLSEQRRAAEEEQLRASERSLRQMIETIPGMLWSATPDGEIDYCNGQLLEYAGFSPPEVMGRNWTKLLHPDDVEPAVHVWTSCVATGAPYRVEVRTFHAADRSYRWCATAALPLLDPQGRILKWYGTVVDMHDWKQAQEDLRNTQAELAHMTRVMTMGELTASIAHEVKQPLAGIVTNANTCLRMLAAEPPNLDGARETARRTIRDGNRAADVITRLRALFSKKEISAESVDMNEAAREVIALYSGALQRNRVLVRADLAEALPPIIGDRIQLQQVILNLLTNASDAMTGVDDRPREVLIRTQLEPPDLVRVTVRDNGVGLNPQDASKVFTAFYTTKHGGMGIGLSVSRSIIENHRGRLWASGNDGPGATFSFCIPRDSGAAIRL